MATGGGFGRSIDIGSDILYDFSCTPCAYNNRNEEAESYCVECREYFCVSCIKDHNKFAIMRAHQILDKAGMLAMGPQQTSIVLTERCQEHNGNTIDTYCPVHQAVGCGTCIALKHGSCKGIAYIPKVAQGFKKTKEYKNIKPAIKSSLQQLQAFKTTIQTDLEDLYRERDVSLKEIKEYRKSIEKELDRMERKITDEVHTKCTILQAEIKANMKSVENNMAKLESHLKKLERIKAENEAVIFVCVKDGNMKIAESAELLQNMNSVSQRETLKFKQYRDIDECMKRFEKLGELHDEISTISYQTPNDIRTVVKFPPKQNKLCSASLTGEYNVEVKTDSQTCYISGCTFLDDRMILITDRENRKLKRLNSSFQITDFCVLPSSPYGLCATGNTEVAVALLKEQKVQFVSVGKYMRRSRSFTTKGQCTGLAYGNENIFISNYKSNEVHIYNTNGQCLRTITVDISALTSKFSHFTHIALSKDHSKLVFSNSNNGIIIVNVKNGHNDCICTDQLSGARGLCVLDNDNILVADYSSNAAIFQITGDGQMMGAVVQRRDGIERPVSVCVDKTNTRMIVTSYDSDNINVFKLMK